MRAASIQQIKEELQSIKTNELTGLCLRLARFKKENKELLTYLLFEASDETGFVNGVKAEINELFAAINLSHLYFAKKSLRKIVRLINKYCRYSGISETEIELRLYFCQMLKASGIPITQNPVIHNLFLGQIKKTETVLSQLHEDLQYDYRRGLDALH